MRTATQTAELIARAFRECPNKGRLTRESLERIADSSQLRSAYLVAVMTEVQNYGVSMFELRTGDFGLVWMDNLVGARALIVEHDHPY
jgi:hypothetical protein